MKKLLRENIHDAVLFAIDDKLNRDDAYDILDYCLYEDGKECWASFAWAGEKKTLTVSRRDIYTQYMNHAVKPNFMIFLNGFKKLYPNLITEETDGERFSVDYTQRVEHIHEETEARLFYVFDVTVNFQLKSVYEQNDCICLEYEVIDTEFINLSTDYIINEDGNEVNSYGNVIDEVGDIIEFDKMIIKKHIDNGGYNCPYCKSDNIIATDDDEYDRSGTMTTSYRCDDCDKKYHETYQLIDVYPCIKG